MAKKNHKEFDTVSNFSIAFLRSKKIMLTHAKRFSKTVLFHFQMIKKKFSFNLYSASIKMYFNRVQVWNANGF